MPRVLSRRHSSPRPVLVTQKFVVEGGLVKKPLSLPTFIMPGLDEAAAQVMATSGWLHQVLGGMCRDACLAEKISQWLSEVRAAVDASTAEHVSDGGETDDDPISSCASARSCRKKKSPSPAVSATVTVRGERFRVIMLRRSVYIPANTQEIQAALNAIQGQDEKEPAPKKPKVKREDVDESEKGKVNWNHRRRTWEIKYMIADGTSCTRTKGLTPPSEDFSGQKLSDVDYEAARQNFWKKARRMWNELDQSGEARFDVDADVDK
jgi:hypothetical protein